MMDEHHLSCLLCLSLLVLLPVSVYADIGEIKEGKLLIAVYTSGNTLESAEGLITGDIAQMMSGLNGTTPETCEVLVAYGGANKTGWHGMTIASSTELKEDLNDGVIGNDDCFSLRDPSADMGNATSLGSFLTYIRDQYRYERVFLILIGHGQAYTGMLFDENHNGNGLTVAELIDAFRTGGYNVDLLGIDSCLMSCIEVASGISGYAGYMIASEESEPAAGWEYEPWIRYLTLNPDASHEDHAQVLFSEYMANPDPGKTISLLDLSYIGEVTASLDRLSHDMIVILENPSDRFRMRDVITSSQQFGLTGTGDLEEATFDLYDFTGKMRTEFPYLDGEGETLIDAINRTVLLSRHDELTSGAHGLSILSPVLITPPFYLYFRDQAAVTPGWDRFIYRYLSVASEQDPELISSGKTIPQFQMPG